MSYIATGRSQARARPLAALGVASTTVPGTTVVLPTIRSKADAFTFIQQKATDFASPKMQKLVATGRAELKSKLSVALPAGIPMSLQEAGEWSGAWVDMQGFPDTPGKVAAMGEAFVLQNAGKIGVPPEVIAGVNLVTHMPKTAEEGAAWVAGVGKGFAETFGVPMSEAGLTSAAARAAAANFGVDPNLVTTGVALVRDGKITASDVETVAIAAASYAGAAAFSAIGLPAPIGAMIGSLLGQTVVGIIKNLCGPDEMATQHAAYASALRARNARMAECLTAGEGAWHDYNRYWDEMLWKIQKILERPEVVAALAKSGGVRFFGSAYDPTDLTFQHFCLTQSRDYSESQKPAKDGCLYFCVSQYNATTMLYAPACDKTACDKVWDPKDSVLTLTDIRNKYCTPGGQPVVAMRLDYSDWHVPLTKLLQPVTLGSGGKVGGKILPEALLHYWFADRLISFPSYNGGNTDADALKNAAYVPFPSGKGTQEGDCTMSGSVTILTENIDRLTKASTHVMEDIIRTVASQAARDAAAKAKADADALARARAETAAIQTNARTRSLASAAAKAKADADALARARAETAAIQTNARTRSLAMRHAMGLSKEELAAYQKCVMHVPPAGYPGCRSVAKSSVAALAAQASAAASARVRRRQLVTGAKWVSALALLGAAGYAWKRSHRS